MARNTLNDLNDLLFEQMEKLRDDEMSEEQIKREISRANALTGLAEVAVRNGELAFKVMNHLNEYRKDGELTPVPQMLRAGEDFDGI